MGQLPTCHVGHADVGEKKIDLGILSQYLQSTGTIPRTENIQADVLARGCGDLQDLGIIIDNENC